MKKFLLLFLSLNVLMSYAQIGLPKIINNNMVLQQGAKVPIWGTAQPGESINVKFQEQSLITKCDSFGKWRVYLEPLKATFESQTMTICGSDTITLNNIQIGEVWLCSGQSNMDYPMDRSIKKYKGPINQPDLSVEELKLKSAKIRFFYVEKRKAKADEDIASKGWVDVQDTTLRYLSQIGYFFGKELADSLKVPVGIISSSWGGTMIEEWTPPTAYQNNPVFTEFIKTEAYLNNPKKPVGRRFSQMIEPMMPYGVKGVLWYQAESNCMINDSLFYAEKFKLWSDTWRTLFENREMPIYYAQIAPFLYTKRAIPVPADGLPLTWEAQLKLLSIPHTAMVVTTDLVDSLKDIHPWNKWDVAHRFTLCALANSYGKKELVYSGPLYKSCVVKGKKMILDFDFVGSGLKSSDGKPLSWFTIAGSDGQFVPAEAEIVDNKVVVSSKLVKKPVAVRLGWDEKAQPNLINREGLPASPFRTDAPVWNY